MTDDPEFRDLYRNVLDRPEDDLPRQVIADKLRDMGEWERAEFIDVQLELAKLEPNRTHPNSFPAYEIAAKREQELLRAAFETIKPALPGTNGIPLFGSPGNVGVGCAGMVNGEKVSYAIRRGFVSEVRLTLAQFVGGPCVRCYGDGVERGEYDIDLGHCRACHGTSRAPGLAKSLFENHPITSVVLSDREPSNHYGDVWGWRRNWSAAEPSDESRYVLGDKWLFSLLPGHQEEFEGDCYSHYLGRQTALDALYAACVAYGRAAANLPDPAGVRP